MLEVYRAIVQARTRGGDKGGIYGDAVYFNRHPCTLARPSHYPSHYGCGNSQTIAAKVRYTPRCWIVRLTCRRLMEDTDCSYVPPVASFNSSKYMRMMKVSPVSGERPIASFTASLPTIFSLPSLSMSRCLI